MLVQVNCKYNDKYLKILKFKCSSLLNIKIKAFLHLLCSVYIYEEQKGGFKLARQQSEGFSIKNGTRQGSVASPTFFSV